MSDFSSVRLAESSVVYYDRRTSDGKVSEMIVKPVNYDPDPGLSGTCSQADRKTPMCRLLMIQMAFGITYGGCCPLFKNYPLKKYLLILYDWVVIVSFILFEYFAFSNDVFNRLYSKSSNKGIMCILFKFGALSLAIEFLAVKFMLLRYGWNLLHTIKSLGLMNVSALYFRLIVLFMVAMALTYAIIFPLNFTDLTKSLTDVYSDEKIKTIGFFLVGIFFSMNKFAITTTMLFFALSLQQVFTEWTENLRTQNMKVRTLCESILELRQRMEDINSHIGLLMFVKVFINGMFMPSAVCSIFVGQLPVNATIGITAFAITSLVDVCVLCWSSQVMIDSMAELCKEVEKMLILKSFDDCIHKQLYVILSMKNYIRIKVLNLFDLKTVTVLAIIGYVANYAIILIQTTITDLNKQ